MYVAAIWNHAASGQLKIKYSALTIPLCDTKLSQITAPWLHWAVKCIAI